MNKPRLFVKWIFPLVGLIVGIAFMYFYYAGLTVRWHSLGSLPEKVARVEGIDGGYLFVQSDQHNLFAYLLDPDYSDQPVYMWQLVSPRLIKDEAQPPNGKWSTFPLFVTTVQIYEAQFSYNVEGTAYVKIAIEPDNTIWLWKVTRPWGESMCLPVYPVLGVFIAGLAGFILRRIQERRDFRRLLNSAG